MRSPIDKWVAQYTKNRRVRIKPDPESDKAWVIRPHPQVARQWEVVYYVGRKIKAKTQVATYSRVINEEGVVRQLAGLIMTGFSPHHLDCGTVIGNGKFPKSNHYTENNIMYLFYPF